MHIKDCCMVNIAAGIFFINDCGMELLLLLEAFTSPYLLGFENLVYCPLWFFFFFASIYAGEEPWLLLVHMIWVQ